VSVALALWLDAAWETSVFSTRNHNEKGRWEHPAAHRAQKSLEIKMPRSPGTDDLTRSATMLWSKKAGSVKEQHGCCRPDTTKREFDRGQL
jgi:hypothetical protein